jgi:hypothetical protein
MPEIGFVSFFLLMLRAPFLNKTSEDVFVFDVTTPEEASV